ncbi:MAG: hypothetical protein UT69_C0029G0005 [Candidatus Yanofskybacteria bacterium GW2011_GWE1_40_10]|nr:MAG: hypothetical protein UT69_C0029G0005 [Candidatus Yanofskybacteria bacterium GW2011_GWE1_40_10]
MGRSSSILLDKDAETIDLALNLAGTFVKHSPQMTAMPQTDLRWAIDHGMETARIFATALRDRKIRTPKYTRTIGLPDAYIEEAEEATILTAKNIFGSHAKAEPINWSIIKMRYDIQQELENDLGGSSSAVLEVAEITKEIRISDICDSLVIHGSELETISIRPKQFVRLCKENRDLLLKSGKTIYVLIRVGEKIGQYRENLFVAQFYPGFHYLHIDRLHSWYGRETLGAYLLIGKKEDLT